MSHVRRSLAVAAVASVPFLVACGDDGGGGVRAYCDLTRQIDEPSELVDDRRIEALVDAAPVEIADEVEFVAHRLRSVDIDEIDAVFADPDVVRRLEPIEQFERDHCEIDAGDDGAAHTEDGP